MKLVWESKTEFMIQKTLSEGTEPTQFLLLISAQIEPASSPASTGKYPATLTAGTMPRIFHCQTENNEGKGILSEL